MNMNNYLSLIKWWRKLQYSTPFLSMFILSRVYIPFITIDSVSTFVYISHAHLSLNLTQCVSRYIASGNRQPIQGSDVGGGSEDQGPFEFRKILKPSSRNTNRSGPKSPDTTTTSSSSTYSSSCGQQNYPYLTNVDPPVSSTVQYDFRRILRKTDHAPTDTLKRVKGIALVTSTTTDVWCKQIPCNGHIKYIRLHMSV